MARSRNIKPGFFKNETLAECSPLARLLFAGLWCLADREGLLEDRPKRIRAELLPYDDGSVDDLLTELHDAGFILRYAAAGGRFIQVVNFGKHQNPHCKEQASTIPAPDMHGASTVQAPYMNGSCPADSLFFDSLNPCSDANASVDTGKPDADHLACPAEKIVELYHQHMPANPRIKVLNDKRRATIRQRWREAALLDTKPFGYATQESGLDGWGQFFRVCADSDFLTGKVPPLPGRLPFVADLDFLLSPSGFVKCLENKYHREAT
jgi:hypothetical protein